MELDDGSIRMLSSCGSRQGGDLADGNSAFATPSLGILARCKRTSESPDDVGEEHGSFGRNQGRELGPVEIAGDYEPGTIRIAEYQVVSGAAELARKEQMRIRNCDHIAICRHR